MKIVPPDSAISLLYPEPEIAKGQIICITEMRDSDAGALLLCTGTMMGRRKDLYEFMRGSQPTKPFYVRVADLPSHRVLGYASFIHERRDLYHESFLKDAEKIASMMNRCQALVPELLDPTNEEIVFHVGAYYLSLTQKSTLNKRDNNIPFTLSYNPIEEDRETKIEATITADALDSLRETVFHQEFRALRFSTRLKWCWNFCFPPLFGEGPNSYVYNRLLRNGLQEYGWSCHNPEDYRKPMYHFFIIDSKQNRKRYDSLDQAREDLTQGLEKLLEQFDKC